MFVEAYGDCVLLIFILNVFSKTTMMSKPLRLLFIFAYLIFMKNYSV